MLSRSLMWCVAIATAIVVFSTPAFGYAPHTGDRAQDFYGRDIVGGGVVHLEDFRGRWLWVEFWSPN